MKFLERFGGYVFEDWSQIWADCNWYELHFINLFFERDVNCGTIEFDFALLGFGFHVCYQYAETEFVKCLRDMIKED